MQALCLAGPGRRQATGWREALKSEDEFESEEDSGPSKSQVKRELLALQALGERLLEIPNPVLARLPVGDEVRAAIDEARRITSHGARRRQVRFIGKLLRSEDASTIERVIQGLDTQAQKDKQRFHALERWRERLLRDGDEAINELIAEYPQADRQHLRGLVRTALKEEREAKPPAASRKLFRYLREL